MIADILSLVWYNSMEIWAPVEWAVEYNILSMYFLAETTEPASKIYWINLQVEPKPIYIYIFTFVYI